MKTIEFKSKSWHSILYKSSYSNLPEDTFVYYKKLILAMLLFLPSISGHIINLIYRRYKVKSIWVSVHLPIAYFIGHLIINVGRENINYNFLHAYGLGFLVICISLIACVFMFLVMYIIGYILEKIRSLIKIDMNRYCKKIKWS